MHNNSFLLAASYVLKSFYLMNHNYAINVMNMRCKESLCNVTATVRDAPLISGAKYLAEL